MRWEDFRESDNVVDRRSDDAGGGGTMGLPIGGGGLGIGAIVVLSLVSWAFGIDPRLLIGGAEMLNGGARGGYEQPVRPQQASRPQTPPNDQMGRFVSAVLAENEDVWTAVLPAQTNVRFVAPKLVLFNRSTRSACGAASASMGPFYCPNDRQIYLDTSFFRDMQTRFGGGGDFAYAYVISHEMGHHIQNLIGVLGKARAAQNQAAGSSRANAISVRIELMADCLAGVWAANANAKWRILEPGDVDKAVRTAGAIGDDRLQQISRGAVVPDSFTHGTSAQRVQWLEAGLKSGQVSACDTFSK